MKHIGSQDNNATRRWQFPRPGTLLVRLPSLSLCLLVTSVLVLTSMCTKVSPAPKSEDSESKEPEIEKADTLNYTIIVKAPCEMKKLDILAFATSGTNDLEGHKTLVSGKLDTVRFKSTKGELDFCMVANSPFNIKTGAIKRRENLENLEYDFLDDSEECPILSGEVKMKPGKAELQLKPLMCRISLENVTSTLSNYELVEEPRVRLTDIPVTAKPFGSEGFVQQESREYGEWKQLPYDIGLFTQHPGTSLGFYPNETPEDSFGSTRIGLEFVYGVRGKRYTAKAILPPTGRADSLLVDVLVEGADTASLSIYRRRP